MFTLSRKYIGYGPTPLASKHLPGLVHSTSVNGRGRRPPCYIAMLNALSALNRLLRTSK